MGETPISPMHPARAASAARRIAGWFDSGARDLPWRRHPRTGYRALVSELMLQQTQVARVLERFDTFLERFPDVRALAEAPEDEVLAAWRGLGYYRRARMLHAAARAVVDRFDGRVPAKASELRSLPGVGRYTAGAIASIVFAEPEPIVDANVARVLLRLEGWERAPGEPAVDRWAWASAGRIARAGARIGRIGPVNEGLMELGATVCTPRAPKCGRCPVRSLCRSHQTGRTERIPASRAPARRTPLHCAAVIVRRGGLVLIEQRGPGGMWAGLWQAPTIERDDRPVDPEEASMALGLARVRRIGSFTHATTHRDVRFEVFVGSLPSHAAPMPPSRQAARTTRWVRPGQLEDLAISSPQRRILTEMADAEERGSPYPPAACASS